MHPPLAGLDASELIDTRPLARGLQHYLLNNRDLYGLPRKFNVSFDGGGRVSVVADTNDIGFIATRAGESDGTAEVGDQVAGAEADDVLWRAVRRLPERCQTLLRVIAFAAKPDYALIARSLGMPVGSIGPSRARALQKLRETRAMASLLTPDSEGHR